jgi:hypothetical protein
MTKVSVFGQNESEEHEHLKPIEFVMCVNTHEGELRSFLYNIPADFYHVELFSRSSLYDVILAWSEGYTDKIVYLGHWNDGVV